MALTNAEIIWLGRDNSIDLQLWRSGTGTTESSAADLTAVNQIKLNLGSILIDSSDATAGSIRWNQAGYKQGEIRVMAGALSSLSTGYFNASLVVFDPSNTAGIVWDDDVPIRIKSDPLAT